MKAKPLERQAWIVKYLTDRHRVYDSGNDQFHTVDVCDRYFSDDYIAAFPDVKVKWTLIGSNIVPALGRDLSDLFYKGTLKRWTSGIEGLSGQGFPRWVYSYSLKERPSKS